MKLKLRTVAAIAILAVLAAGCVGYCTLAPQRSPGPVDAVDSVAVQAEDGSVAAGVSTQACAGLPPPPGWLAPDTP